MLVITRCGVGAMRTALAVSISVTPRSQALSRLSSDTRLERCVTDADQFMWLSRCMNLDGYRAYVERLFGFEAPLESAYAVTPGLERLIDLEKRVKTSSIASELQTIGMPVDQLLSIVPCRMAPFRDIAEALGWMYVAEHCAATHNMVLRHLVRHLPELTHAADRFECYDSLSLDRWRELGVAIDDVARRGGCDRIREAAVAGFECLHVWMQPDRGSIERGEIAHEQPRTRASAR